MTEVTTAQQAYHLMTAPMKLHKFITPYNNASAFVLAETQEEARSLLLKQCAEIEHASIKYQGAKELYELDKACVLMNQMLPF